MRTHNGQSFPTTAQYIFHYIQHSTFGRATANYFNIFKLFQISFLHHHRRLLDPSLVGLPTHIHTYISLSSCNTDPTLICQMHSIFNSLNPVRVHTLPQCLHFPFSERRCIQWWCVVVCSRYWRMPTSRNVGLHVNLVRSINVPMQLT